MPDLTGDRDEHEEGLEDDGPFSDFTPGPLPIAPDGGIMPGYGVDAPAPPPPMDVANSPCLRGPCQFYWELQTSVTAGNPAGTPGIDNLRHYHRSCTFAADEMDLKDTTVLECSNWDPMDPSRVRERDYRRRKWHAENGIIDTEDTDDGTPAE